MSSVTAVIPCYNGERYLARAIASVRAQTRPVDELVVIDDCSTDRSREVAREGGARVVMLERNSGPSEARNAGLRVASSDLVAFLDADDEWTPEHCALVVGLLERWPEAVLGFGRAAYHDLPRVVSPAAIPDGVPVDALAAMLRENLVTQSAAVVRRDLVLVLGGYDVTMRHAEDYDLWLRCALRGPYVCTHEVTCWRAIHEQQASRDALLMRGGAWRARSKSLAGIADAPRHAAAWSAAVAGWNLELRDAWYGDSPRELDATLAMGREYNLPIGPYWTWMARRYLLWRPRQIARHVWRRGRLRRMRADLPAG